MLRLDVVVCFEQFVSHSDENFLDLLVLLTGCPLRFRLPSIDLFGVGGCV